MVWPNFFIMNVFFALKGSKLFIIIIYFVYIYFAHIMRGSDPLEHNRCVVYCGLQGIYISFGLVWFDA